MSIQDRQHVREEILRRLANHAPLRVAQIAQILRETQDPRLNLEDRDVRAVVQPMIATGRLRYVPGLKVELGK